MLWIVFLAVMAWSNKAQSVNVCESTSCVCYVKTDVDFSETVVCSYDSRVLTKDYSLPMRTFSLNLSRNNLTRVIPTKLLQSNFLTELILSRNRIDSIQNDSFKLPELKRLDLSDNRLETLSGVFTNINKLEYLNLASNRLKAFESVSFHSLGQLREIVLDYNNVGPSLEETNLFDRNGYGLTNKITSLSISGINLAVVHDNFFVDAFNLKKLVVSSNKIRDVFELPFTLEYLDLSDNPIEEVSGEDFADLVALKVLKLNNLWIKEIGDYTFALPALTSLELERNRNLTVFSEMAFGKNVLEDADDFALEKLSLKSSRLHTLDEKLLVPFGQLIHLDLQGNLWRCDCRLVWIKQLQIPARDYEHLRCFTPKPFLNGRIFDIDAKYFVCGIKSKHVGFTIAAVTCVLTLTAIAFCIFTVPRYTTRLGYNGHIQLPTAEYTVLAAQVTIRDS